MRIITRPPLELAIVDEPGLDTGRPELDKAVSPKDGDLIHLVYKVQGEKAVLVAEVPILVG